MSEKMIFVTYTKDNKIRKGSIKETFYNQLCNDNEIKDLTIYPSELLMEQNFSIKMNGVNKNTKKQLND